MGMEHETISISFGDAQKLGLHWVDIADAMDYNRYAPAEGLMDETTIIKVPVNLIKK